MTLYGESPIWSYFKPKAATNSAPPFKKRKLGHIDTTSRNGSDQKAIKNKEKESGFAKEPTSTCENQPLPLIQSTHSPRTPNTFSAGKIKGRDPKRHLPTPPTTGGGPSPNAPLLLLRATQSGNYEAFIKEPTRLLPTPPTLPRNFHRLRVSRDDETPSKSRSGFHTATVDYVGDSIPSSQSQPELFIPPDPLIVASLQNSKSIKAWTSVNEEDLQSIVQSSQSQPPLLIPNNYPPSPIATNRSDANQHAAEAFFECIPSSQSQEIELSRPGDVSELELSLFDKEIPSVRGTGATHPHLQRTFSDDVFPIPVNHSLLDGIFQEDEQAGPQANTAVPKSFQDDVDDSATETESEDDDKMRNESHPRLSPEHSRTAPHQVTLSSQESAYDASQEDASLGGLETSLDTGRGALDGEEAYIVSEDDSSILRSASGSPESCFGSLPPELREIFGDSDDSYPPDFPLSLR